MELGERIVGPVAIVTVTGDITLKRGGDRLLHDRLHHLVQNGPKTVLLNLAGVSYVDSAGLGELVQAYSAFRNQGGSLKLCSLTKRLRDLLVMTNLLSLFDAYDNEEQALAQVRA